MREKEIKYKKKGYIYLMIKSHKDFRKKFFKQLQMSKNLNNFSQFVWQCISSSENQQVFNTRYFLRRILFSIIVLLNYNSGVFFVIFGSKNKPFNDNWY